MPRTWTGQPTAPNFEAADLLYGQKTSAGTPATKEQRFTRSAIRDGVVADKSRVIYVGKHGDDANDGKSLEKALLTIQAAITAAAALTPTPDANNPAAVVCEDAGVYTEDLTGEPFVSIWAPRADLIPATPPGHEIRDGCTWTFRRATRESFGFTLKDGGVAHINLDEAGTETGPINGQYMFLCDARAALLGGILNVRCKKFDGECGIVCSYADGDPAVVNYWGDYIETLGSTATWWDFFCEASGAGTRSAINVFIEDYYRDQASNGCFRSWAANVGVIAKINVKANRITSDLTVAEAAHTGSGSGGSVQISANEISSVILANVTAAGNSVSLFCTQKPTGLLNGVTSEIEIMSTEDWIGTTYTFNGVLAVRNGATSVLDLIAANGDGDSIIKLGENGGQKGEIAYDGGDNEVQLKTGDGAQTVRMRVDRDTGDFTFEEEIAAGPSNVGSVASFGNSVSNMNPFGSLPVGVTAGAVNLKAGAASTSSGTSRAAHWSYANHGDANDNPDMIYGGILLARNGGSNAADDNDAIGLWAEAVCVANAGAGSSTAIGAYFKASGGEANWASWLDGDLRVEGDQVLDSDKATYLGDKDTDGTWRTLRNGDDLIVQRRESGSYITKQTVSADKGFSQADLSAGQVDLDATAEYVEVTAGDATNQLRAWATPTAGDRFSVKNNDGGGTSAIVADNGGSVLATLLDGESLTFVYNGTAWLLY